MSTPLRDAVDDLAGRTLSPDFDELKSRATRRVRRRVAVAAATAAVIAGPVLAASNLGDVGRTAPVGQPSPIACTGDEGVDVEAGWSPDAPRGGGD